MTDRPFVLCASVAKSARFSRANYDARKVSYHWRDPVNHKTAAEAFAHHKAGYLVGLMPIRRGCLVIDIDRAKDKALPDDQPHWYGEISHEPVTAQLGEMGIRYKLALNEISGGIHVYVEYDGTKLAKTTWRLADNCSGEIRYEQGYIVLWDPSVLTRKWIGSRAATKGELHKVLDMGVKPRVHQPRQRKLSAGGDRVQQWIDEADLREGNRHNALVSLFAKCAASGRDPALVFALARGMTNVGTGHERVVQKMWESALAKFGGQARHEAQRERISASASRRAATHRRAREAAISSAADASQSPVSDFTPAGVSNLPEQSPAAQETRTERPERVLRGRTGKEASKLYNAADAAGLSVLACSADGLAFTVAGSAAQFDHAGRLYADGGSPTLAFAAPLVQVENGKVSWLCFSLTEAEEQYADLQSRARHSVWATDALHGAALELRRWREALAQDWDGGGYVEAQAY